MGHNHAHHHPAPSPEKMNTAFSIAIFANTFFVIIEVVYAYLAHSTSLLADAGHNLGDVLGLIFAWIATLLLKKKASDRYSYGFKRTTIIASLTNAIVLLLATLLIIREAIQKFVDPSTMVTQDVMIVAFIGILVNAGTAVLFLKGAKEDLNVKGAFLHLASDALVSLGVVIIAALVYFTHWEWLDPMAGLLIGVVIVIGTWNLLRDSIRLIMDGVPNNVDIADIKEYLEQIPGVTGVHDLHVWGLSTRENALTVHLIAPDHDFSDDERHTMEAHLKTNFNVHHITIQIERGDGANACLRTHNCNQTVDAETHNEHDHDDHSHDGHNHEDHNHSKETHPHEHAH